MSQPTATARCMQTRVIGRCTIQQFEKHRVVRPLEQCSKPSVNPFSPSPMVSGWFPKSQGKGIILYWLVKNGIVRMDYHGLLWIINDYETAISSMLGTSSIYNHLQSSTNSGFEHCSLESEYNLKLQDSGLIHLWVYRCSWIQRAALNHY